MIRDACLFVDSHAQETSRYTDDILYGWGASDTRQSRIILTIAKHIWVLLAASAASGPGSNHCRHLVFFRVCSGWDTSSGQVSKSHLCYTAAVMELSQRCRKNHEKSPSENPYVFPCPFVLNNSIHLAASPIFAEGSMVVYPKRELDTAPWCGAFSAQLSKYLWVELALGWATWAPEGWAWCA